MNRSPLAAVVLLILPCLASTPAGDTLLARAKAAEAKGAMDEALTLAVAALKTDPNDTEYMLVEARIRAFDAQQHLHAGNILLEQKKLQDALAEFEKATAIDPSAARTQAAKVRDLLNNALQNAKTGEILTPHERAMRAAEQRFSTIKPQARLEAQLTKPLPHFQVNQQPSSEVFAMLGRLAGVRVLFDPDYQDQSLGKNQSLDFRGLTLEEAFDSVSLITKSFWKPVSRDTILVTNEDASKRNVYDDQIAKVLYLTNAPTPQEVTRIGETVKSVTDLKKLMIHPDQNALVMRGDTNRVALAEKLVADLDKPKAEIIIDVIVLSVSKDWVRDLGLVFGITPGSMNVTFQPNPALKGSGSVAGSIPLSALRHLSAGDFGITLPGAALSALLSNTSTKIIDKAQLRTIEGQRSTLKIGQRVPYATGSFAPGGLSSASPLVNTQFSFFDVGLNLDVIAKVHESNEVSLHIESDHSSVSDYQNVGGLNQPVVTQRKRVADVRAKEGEVNFWDIVTQHESTQSQSGVPGLMNLPWVGKFFSATHREEKETLLLHLLVPHVVRSTEIKEVNIAGIVSGNDQVVKLSYETGSTAMRSGPTTEVLQLERTLPPSVPPPAAASNAAAAATGATGALTIAFSPASATAAPGGKFQVDVVVGPAADLGSASLVLKYDASALNLAEASPGGLLGRDGAAAQVKPEPLADGSGMKFDITRPGTGAGATGPGTLVTLVFEAAKQGPTKVTLGSFTLTSSAGKEIPAVAAEPLDVVVQ